MKIEKGKIDPQFSIIPLVLADAISTSGSSPVIPEEPGQDSQDVDDD